MWCTNMSKVSVLDKRYWRSVSCQIITKNNVMYIHTESYNASKKLYKSLAMISLCVCVGVSEQYCLFKEFHV